MVEAPWLADDRIAWRDSEIARLRAELASPLPCPVVAPFWLGLPNEILSLVVHAGAPALTATLGGLGHDEASDDPRVNPGLPFGLGPL